MKKPSGFLYLMIGVLWCVASSNSYALNLKESIRTSLEKNLDLKISQATTGEKKGAALSANGDFDFNLSGSLTKDYDNTPSLSSLDGVDSAVKTHNLIWTGSLSKKILTGSEFTFSYENTISQSNSSNNRYPTSNSPVFTLGLSQPLIRAFKPSLNTETPDTAEMDWEIQKQKHGQKIVDTVFKTIEIYYDTLKAKEELKIRSTSYQLSKQNLRTVQSKRRAGKSSAIDLIEAESEKQTNYEAKIRAETTFEDKKQELALHVFADVTQKYELTENLGLVGGPGKLPGQTTLVDEALKVRQDYQAAELDRKKLETNSSNASFNRLPNVTLTADVSSSGIGDDAGSAHTDTLNGTNLGYSAGVSISHPVMMYSTRGNHQMKKNQLRQKELSELKLKQDIALEIHKTVRQIKSNWERVRALNKASKAESEKYQGESRRFKAGKISTYDLNKALKDKQVAEIELVKARIAYIMSKYRLDKFRGRLLQSMGLEKPINSPFKEK